MTSGGLAVVFHMRICVAVYAQLCAHIRMKEHISAYIQIYAVCGMLIGKVKSSVPSDQINDFGNVIFTNCECSSIRSDDWYPILSLIQGARHFPYDKNSANTASCFPKCYKKCDGSQDAYRGSLNKPK